MDIHSALISQYTAALHMLRSAVEQCPESAWEDGAFDNRFWQVAYHALFYTHLYLSPSEEEFVPWERGRANAHVMGTHLPWPPHDPLEPGEPYSQEEVLLYADLVEKHVAAMVPALPLDAPSGFPWLPFDRMELHLYTMRHLQHHAGQLIERLRTASGIGTRWIGMHRPALTSSPATP